MTLQRSLLHVWFALAVLVAVLAGPGAAGAHADDARASTDALPGAPLPARAIQDADSEPEEPGDSGRKDNLQLGGLIGAGFPRPLAIEAMVKVQRLVAVGVEYSLLPEITISGVHTSFWAVAADMRVFPLRNGFFVGLRAGRQHLAADTILAVGPQLIPLETEVQTTFLNPRVGILWTWSSGITLGIDAGLQIPVSSRTSGALAASDGLVLPPGVQGMDIIDRVRGVADYLGESTIPTFDLLRFGLLL
jgi:hypothetical protein